MSVCLDFFLLNAYTIGVDMCVCLLTINSFDRLCQQSVLFICQPLNQQQTARCDKCDVGWGLSLIHISEPTRQAEISYAVFCLKKKYK